MKWISNISKIMFFISKVLSKARNSINKLIYICVCLDNWA